MNRGAADEVEQILVEVEEDHVADHIAVVVTGDELLRPARLKTLEAINAEA